MHARGSSQWCAPLPSPPYLTNEQLSELVASDGYAEWISIVATFTIDSFHHWQWAANSVYYLLSLWSRLVASMPYLKGDTPSQLESFVPQVITAFINSRMELVRALPPTTLPHGGSTPLRTASRWFCPSSGADATARRPRRRPRRPAQGRGAPHRAARDAAEPLPLPAAAGRLHLRVACPSPHPPPQLSVGAHAPPTTPQCATAGRLVRHVALRTERAGDDTFPCPLPMQPHHPCSSHWCAPSLRARSSTRRRCRRAPPSAPPTPRCAAPHAGALRGPRQLALTVVSPPSQRCAPLTVVCPPPSLQVRRTLAQCEGELAWLVYIVATVLGSHLSTPPHATRPYGHAPPRPCAAAEAGPCARTHAALDCRIRASAALLPCRRAALLRK